MKKIIQIIINISLLLICFFYLYLNRLQLNVLKNLDLDNIIIISVIFLLFFFITGYTFKLLISLLNIELSIIETIGLSILTNFGNYLGPARPGAVLKAMYLKSVKGFAYSKFVSVLSAYTFLLFLMSGIVGVLLLLLLKNNNVEIPILLFIICNGLIIGSILPFICKNPHLKGKNKITKHLQSALEGFNIIQAQKVKLIIICLVFIIQFLFSALLYITTFSSLGFKISFLSALVIGVFTSISNFFTITPNNIGIQEAVSAYLFTLTGFDFASGFIGASVIRVIHIVITFSLTPIFAHFLLKSMDMRLLNILQRKNSSNLKR